MREWVRNEIKREREEQRWKGQREKVEREGVERYLDKMQWQQSNGNGSFEEGGLDIWIERGRDR